MEPLPVAVSLLTPVVLLAVTVLGRRFEYAIPYRLAVPVCLLAGLGVAVATESIDTDTALRAAILLGFAAAILAIHYLDAPRGDWMAPLRTRFLMGVPWGTVFSILFVSAVYLFLQGGLENPNSPLSVPFTSWSYFYPLGLITAPFAHANLGHVTGNLIGTVALAPVAEYAWGHFPTRRGESSFGTLRTNPYVRAFVLFPVGVLVVGLATSVFSWGAIIGFSGVVFAYAGFAAVRYPILTVIALSTRGAINTVYHAFRDPVVVSTAGPSFGPPWWVGIAVQGHLLGLLLGALLGVIIVGRRRRLPSAARIFAGIVLLGFSFALYALWWYRNPTTFVLYRGLGVLLIVVLAVVLTVAMRSRPIEIVGGITRREVAVGLVILPLITMGFVAVPLNTTTVDNIDPPEDAIEIRDYHIYYAEDVTNERVGGIDIEVLNETTAVEASGVIVVSESRTLWTEAGSTASLAFWGDVPVRVGGIGWRETVWAKRQGWNVNGGDAVYNVFLQAESSPYEHVFASANATADPIIDNRNVTVTPSDSGFHLTVSNNTTVLGQSPIPSPENTTKAGGITFVRKNDTVYATRGGTRVLIATKETYE